MKRYVKGISNGIVNVKTNQKLDKIQIGGNNMLLRTLFVALALLLALLSTAGAEQQSCSSDEASQLTSSDALGPFYIAGSPSTPTLAPTTLLRGQPEKVLNVSGTIFGYRQVGAQDPEVTTSRSNATCNQVALPDTVVEVWYAGPPDENGNYYQDSNYRGQLITDHCGRYSFVQIFPSLYPTRPILHNHFRVSAQDRPDAALLVTQMYFAGTGDGYVDPASANSQTVQVETTSSGDQWAQFDIYLEVEVGASAVALPEDANNTCTTPVRVTASAANATPTGVEEDANRTNIAQESSCWLTMRTWSWCICLPFAFVVPAW